MPQINPIDKNITIEPVQFDDMRKTMQIRIIKIILESNRLDDKRAAYLMNLSLHEFKALMDNGGYLSHPLEYLQTLVKRLYLNIAAASHHNENR